MGEKGKGWVKKKERTFGNNGEAEADNENALLCRSARVDVREKNLKNNLYIETELIDNNEKKSY